MILCRCVCMCVSQLQLCISVCVYIGRSGKSIEYTDMCINAVIKNLMLILLAFSEQQQQAFKVSGSI